MSFGMKMSRDDVEFILSEKSVWRCDSCQQERCKSLQLESTVSKSGKTTKEILNFLREMTEESKQIQTLECKLSKSVDAYHEKILNTMNYLQKLTSKLGL
uniref:Uncharacterized protein n=1 Tax=Clastoptera arizonana TaxID=38151 RepID=A0A1B6CM15_9HEMI